MPIPMGSGGAFGSVTSIMGPLMMLAIALRHRGSVRKLLDVHADCPDRARKPESLGIELPPLEPLIRSGVVVRERDGRVWVDRAKAKKRQWRIGLIFGGLGLLIALAAWVAFAM